MSELPSQTAQFTAGLLVYSGTDDPGDDAMELDRIREFLSYDPETGEFRWIKSPGERLSNGRITGHIAEVGSIAGGAHCAGYWFIRFREHQILAHRLAWWFVHGEMPSRLDHKDGNRQNNRISNLRRATHQQNQQNVKIRCSNTSGFKGVSYDKRRDKFYVRVAGQFIGFFDWPHKAAEAYDVAASAAFGEFARLNFPKGEKS